MKKSILIVLIGVLLLPGCGSMKNMSDDERVGLGAQVGSFFGWLLGGLLGDAIGDERGADIGAFIGTAAGGITGASIAQTVNEQRAIERITAGKSFVGSYALLPDLRIEDILLHEDSLTHNRKIDAGETCYLSFIIVNNSFQEALNVVPVVKVKQGAGLEVSEPVRIARVSREDPVVYDVMVRASRQLETGEAVFSVRLEEERGNGTEEEEFTVELQADTTVRAEAIQVPAAVGR